MIDEIHYFICLLSAVFIFSGFLLNRQKFFFMQPNCVSDKMKLLAFTSICFLCFFSFQLPTIINVKATETHKNSKGESCLHILYNRLLSIRTFIPFAIEKKRKKKIKTTVIMTYCTRYIYSGNGFWKAHEHSRTVGLKIYKLWVCGQFTLATYFVLFCFLFVECGLLQMLRHNYACFCQLNLIEDRERVFNICSPNEDKSHQ